jgi:lipase maturation factor 1
MPVIQQLLLRATCFVYTVAFLGAFLHNDALVGSNGLLPASVYFKRVAGHFGSSRSEMLSLPIIDVVYYGVQPSSTIPNTVRAFQAVPSIFWWVPDSMLDTAMVWAADVGLGISVIVLLTGRSNMLIMLCLWALYFSVMSAGQSFYSFGWESQLLETGVIAAFLVKPWSLARPATTPMVPLILFRWLLFRVMFGSGMIKLRGDACWRDATCMQHHYQTQPNPNPLARLFHASPTWFHAIEVYTNHFVEVVAPFFVMLPQPAAMIGGGIQIVFQLIIIAGGNLSFLNWLTMIPALACFDEGFLQRLLSSRKNTARPVDDLLPLPPQPTGSKMASAHDVALPWSWYVRYCLVELPTELLHWSFLLLVVYLSVPVVENMVAVSGPQVMNANYDWLRLVNTHGNFGSITRTRMEVTLEGRSATEPHVWLPYEFPCKPGADLHRRPCFASPFHYRLDWLMWFAGFQRIEQAPWLVHLALKALMAPHNPDARAVLEQLGVEDPFLRRLGDRPTHVRLRSQELRLQPIALGNATAVLSFLSDVAASVWSGNRSLPTPYWRTVGRPRTYMDAMTEEQLVSIARQFLS